MEMPIVDNEFISLFLPEDSSFTTEDILNDFKFYIFRLMSLSLDSLIQEQVSIPNKLLPFTRLTMNTNAPLQEKSLKHFSTKK
jgi:hypothetical protein